MKGWLQGVRSISNWNWLQKIWRILKYKNKSFLHSKWTIHVFVDPYVSSPPKDKISSTNKVIAKNLGFTTDGGDSDLRAENAKLRTQIDKLLKENESLRQKVAELSGQPSVVTKLQNAKETDNAVNG